MTMEAVLLALRAAYPNDFITPGLQIASIGDKGEFYCAVHRFPAGVESRTVVAKGRGPDVASAISACVAIWQKILSSG